MCVLGGISKSLRVGKCWFCLCGLALAARGLFELNPVGRCCFTAYISLRQRNTECELAIMPRIFTDQRRRTLALGLMAGSVSREQGGKYKAGIYR